MPPTSKTVNVRLPGQSYDIRVEPGVLARAGEHLARLTKNRRAFAVTDDIVGPLHAQTLMQSLQSAGFHATLITLPAGESQKTLANVSVVYDSLLRDRIERSSIVIGLGGGVIGDMTGFAAATVLRGVPLVQCPTTLLSMVDASVGGKTGVNHAAGKNLIGAFHQPIAVLIDPMTLLTTSPGLISEGLAECVKHEIIRDKPGFEGLEKNIHRAIAMDMEYLSTLITHNVAIKARVVELDPYESGERAHLNLGHTFGHAIEKVSNFRIPHGIAVALGISAASWVAESCGSLQSSERLRILALLTAAGLPTKGLDGLAIDDVVDAMYSDKKVAMGRLRLVLPRGIGNAELTDDVEPAAVRRALESLLN